MRRALVMEILVRSKGSIPLTSFAANSGMSGIQSIRLVEIDLIVRLIVNCNERVPGPARLSQLFEDRPSAAIPLSLFSWSAPIESNAIQGL